MKRKYRLMRVMIYERKALENYINSMAKDNWHVDKLGLNYIRFENREDSIHYVVVLNGDIEEKDMMYETNVQKKLRSFMEDFDLNFVCSNGMFQIYSSRQDLDIYTDEQTELSTICQTKIKNGYPSCYRWAFLWLAIVVAGIWAMYAGMLSLNSNANLAKALLILVSFFGFIFATREIITLYRYKKRQILQDDPGVFHTRWCFSVMVILSILHMTCFLEFKYLFFLSYIFLGKYIIFPLLKTVSEETKEKVFFGLLIILTIIVCL